VTSTTPRAVSAGDEPSRYDEAEQAVRPAAHAGRELEHAGRRRDLDDVDDVIGLAAELRAREAGELTLADLEEVGRELDIEERYVRQAVAALDAKRREAARAEEQAQERRRERARLLARLAAGVAAAALVLGLGAWLVGGSVERELRVHHADVEAKRAQVVNVLERKAAAERQWRDAPASPGRDAELSGAENRVRIERKRYDEAAARYNAARGGSFTSFWARRAELPERVPMSNEVRW